jgi:hypothetical protein
MTINTKCGKAGVQFIENGGHSDQIITIAYLNSFDSETMSSTSYWFTIGTYKTMKNAIRQAAKKMQRHSMELAI